LKYSFLFDTKQIKLTPMETDRFQENA